jgi:hypothetical protein
MTPVTCAKVSGVERKSRALKILHEPLVPPLKRSPAPRTKMNDQIGHKTNRLLIMRGRNNTRFE